MKPKSISVEAKAAAMQLHDEMQRRGFIYIDPILNPHDPTSEQVTLTQSIFQEVLDAHDKKRNHPGPSQEAD